MDEPAVPQSGRIDGPEAWQEALMGLWAEAAAHGGDLWLQDVDFLGWSLGLEASVLHWNQWAVAHRRCEAHLVAQDWRHARLAHPRWCRWQPTWTHRVHMRVLPDDEMGAVDGCRTIAVLGQRLALWLDDVEKCRGGWSRSAQIARAMTQKVDANLQRSSDSGGASMLGL